MIRIISIYLKGYKAIYNGMLRDDIFIDFSNFVNKITLLKGSSGRGKSTIQSALSLLPESNSNFIDGQEAEKIFKFMNIATGDLYTAHFIHGVKNNGNRETVKAYLIKSNADFEVNLNPNGNLGSYKTVIENEFDIDLGFLTFSRITNENKGLVEKTPSERKKIINLLLKDTEIYDSMNKKSTALFNQYKGIISSITEKLNKIPEPELIDNAIKVHNQELENNKARVDNLNIKKGELINKSRSIDPDGFIMARYNEISSELQKISNTNIELVDINELKILKDQLNVLKDNINTNKNNLEKKEITLNHKNEILREKSERDTHLSSKLDSLKIIDINDINNKKDLLLENMNKKMKVINDMGITDINSISSNDYLKAVGVLQEIENISQLICDSNISIIDRAIANFNINTPISTQDLNNRLIELNKQLTEIDYKIDDLTQKMELISILDKRPANCKIDSCEFIKSAIELSRSIPNENELLLRKESIKREIEEIENEIELKENVKVIVSYLNQIKSLISYNKDVFNKISYIPEIFKDMSVYTNNIHTYTFFTDTSKIYSNLSEINIIEEYKNNVNQLIEYDNIIAEFKKDEGYINEYIEESKNIKREISILMNEISALQNEYNSLSNTINKDTNTFNDMNNKIKLAEENLELLNTKNALENEYNSILKNINTLNDINREIELIDNEINSINVNIINDLIQKLGILEGDLANYHEYLEELEKYNKEYETISLIKKYSNPSGFGIQTIFMKYYMNSIIDSTNEFLSYFFNGEFSLLEDNGQNPDEFKIPCHGNGILHDDISSMSFSQRCIVSMLISISLYKKSSNIYDVLMLDEIDSGLDSIQRQIFAKNIDNISENLGLSHIVIISHNNEFNESYCDVINLDDYAS